MGSKSQRGYRRSDWIYDWKQPTRSRLHSWVAVVLVAVCFALGGALLRVRIDEPAERSVPSAVRMHLGSEGIGRSLVEQAREQGPFPTRFEPTGWDGFEAYRVLLRQSTEAELTPHQPRLLAFPEPPAKPPRLARRGEPVLPERPLAVAPSPDPGPRQMVPVVSALDGIKAAELPAQLPTFEGELGAQLAGGQWRYLMELDDQGRVRQCVAMAGGAAPHPPLLRTWLHSLVFRTAPREEGRRWVAIAVGFENRKSEDGADPQ